MAAAEPGTMERKAVQDISEEDVPTEENLGTIGKDSLIKQVLDRCITRLVEYLAPRYLLDRFIQRGCVLFCQIRDISEKPLTSEKNRDIYEVVRRNPNIYVTFKEALVETKQTNLAKLLTDTEQSVHDELKGIGYECQCSGAKECNLLKELTGSPAEHVGITPPAAVQDVKHKLIQIYQECYLHLPVNPLTAEITKPMSNLYVPPTLKLLDYSQITSRWYDSNFSKDDIRVTSIAEILTPTAKKIFIVGEVGMGKTTYCRHIIRAWCNAQLERPGHESTINGDEKIVMSNFDLLFFIPLKDYEFCGDIEMMIRELVGKDIADLLQEQRCLIILDGLDEWVPPKDYKRPLFVTKGLPNRIITNKYTILTTLRPWMLASVKPKPSEIDVLVQIHGLDGSAVHQLTKNLLSVLGSDSDTEPFFRNVDQAGLESYIRVPIVLAQLVCLWASENSFGEGLTDVYVNMIERCLALINHEEKHSARDGKVESIVIPPCFRKLHCQLYWDLLLGLSKLAYYFLFKSGKESTKAYAPLLSLDDKRIAMKAGLLSESVVYNKGIVRENKISFVHRSFEEALAALYMATEKSSMENEFEAFNSIESVLNVRNSVIFLCGIHTGLFEQLSGKVMAVVDRDEGIKEYRCCSLTANIGVIEKIQNLILACLEETFYAGSLHARAHLHDIVIHQDTTRSLSQISRKTNKQGIKSLLRAEELKSVFIKTDCCITQASSEDPFPGFLKDVEESRQLEKLHLDDSRHVLTTMDVYGLICQSYSTLRTLCLEWINFDELGKRFSLVLEKLSLVSLCLRHVRVAHSQLDDLQRGLHGLKELELREVRCVDCPFQECRYSLVLDSNILLKRLTLSGLGVKKVKCTATGLVYLETGPLLWPDATETIFSNILDNNNITQLVCNDYPDIDVLHTLLPRLSKLQSIQLSRTDLGKSVLTMPPRLASLDFVRLEYVTMSRKASLQFVDSIHSLPRVVRVELFAVASQHDLLVITYHLRRNPSKFLVIKDTDKEIWFETRHDMDIKKEDN